MSGHAPVCEGPTEAFLGVLRADLRQLVRQLAAQLFHGHIDQSPTSRVFRDVAEQPRLKPCCELRQMLCGGQRSRGELADHRGLVCVELSEQTQLPDASEVRDQRPRDSYLTRHLTLRH